MAKNKKSTPSLQKFDIPIALPRLSELMSIKSSGETKLSNRAFLLTSENAKLRSHIIERHALPWQKRELQKSKKDLLYFSGSEGMVFIIQRSSQPSRASSHSGILDESDYAWAREQGGFFLSLCRSMQLADVAIQMCGVAEEFIRGFVVGLNLNAYNFKNQLEGTSLKDLPQFEVSHNYVEANKKMLDWFQETLASAEREALAINLARHLVNLPPNFLNPKSFADFCLKYFKGRSGLTVEVWNAERLKNEKMGLHLGVGRGAEHPPCMVHFRFRPKAASKEAPIAFVGKGLTFDSGGYDIKPSAGMRLMKKDMGGAATVVGLVDWVCNSKLKRNLDFYIGLAENMVDANSMRPSDVLTARNGMKIEIHNTDAEGRLVLADVLDVAVSQTGKDEPQSVINVATLTGAIKVALGADIAGLFTNHDPLSESLIKAAHLSGDFAWRMPLYSRYTSSFSSSFGDMVNAVDGFGGAITAALFLEKFVRNKPWAHLDIYAWNDKPTGSLSFAGGNGQAVQMLIEFLRS